MAIEFIISPAVSITNGSKTLNVTGDVDTYHVFNGTSVVIGNNPVIALVEGVSGSGQPDGSGNSTITLAENWTLPDVVDAPMIAFNTNEGMAQAQRNAREAADKLIAYLGNQELLLSSTEPSVIIDVAGVPTEFIPYKYLSDSAESAVDTLNSLEPRIDQAEEDLSTIEDTLDAKVAAAAASETNAANSETNAANSETNAANSETNAAASETNAAASASAAEAAFDNFDDKYLGSKASDPTVDNDGDPLQVGMSYWNSTDDELRFYNGAAWESPESTASQAAQAAAASETNAAASETNAANSETNAAASETNAANSETNAAASETNAANSETNAISAKDISMANANFKGDWPDLVGAANIPYSAKDGDAVYMLLNNIPDVTASQPSVDTTNWFLIATIGQDVDVLKFDSNDRIRAINEGVTITGDDNTSTVKIVHILGDGYVQNEDLGHFYFRNLALDKDIYTQVTNADGSVETVFTGFASTVAGQSSARMYYGGNYRIITRSDGIGVYGDDNASHVNIINQASGSYIQNMSRGVFFIRNSVAGEDTYVGVENIGGTINYPFVAIAGESANTAYAQLRYGSNAKLSTKSDGVQVSGKVYNENNKKFATLEVINTSTNQTLDLQGSLGTGAVITEVNHTDGTLVINLDESTFDVDNKVIVCRLVGGNGTIEINTDEGTFYHNGDDVTNQVTMNSDKYTSELMKLDLTNWVIKLTRN